MKLLLVDDEEIVFKAVGGFLSRVGHQVTTALNGTQALERIAFEVPDVVLSDIRMPEMDGLVLLEILRVRCPMVPVILITGHGDVDTAVSALQKGAYDYIRKPVKLDELVSLLERVEERKRLEQTLVEERVGLACAGRSVSTGAPAAGVARELAHPAAGIRGSLQTLQNLWKEAAPALRRLADNGNAEAAMLVEGLPGLVAAMLADIDRITCVLSEAQLQGSADEGGASQEADLARWVDAAVAQATAGKVPPERPTAPPSAADLQGN